MGRADWETGRFNVDWETSQISAAIAGYQSTHGDFVDYYRFLDDVSVMGDIYDEGQLSGRVFQPPVRLPVIHVICTKGPNTEGETGAYYNNLIHITASFDSVTRSGLTYADIKHQLYLSDRVGYDTDIYKVNSMDILGQVQRRDVIVAISGVQLKPDELVDDQMFSSWASRTTDPLGG